MCVCVCVIVIVIYLRSKQQCTLGFVYLKKKAFASGNRDKLWFELRNRGISITGGLYYMYVCMRVFTSV